MFAKLLKHEWKATGGVMLILSVAALCAGAVGTLLMRLLVNSAATQTDETVYSVLGIMLAFMFLALIAYAVGSAIFLFVRFYKNKFTDEGYLTFTLPVRSWQIFLSSLLNIMVWNIIIILVVAFSVFSMIYFGLLETGIWEEIGNDMVMGEISVQLSGSVPLQLLCSVIEFVSGIIVMMSCITLGAIWAKKHKLIAAIGIYYGLSMLSGIVSTVIMASSMAAASDWSMDHTYVYQTIYQALLGVGGFFLSTYLMNKKLNLP